MLAIRNLHMRYANGTHALRGINLDIKRGEFVVVIGLSGSGKSTLLRCINRLVTPTEGTITMDDLDITAVRGGGLRKLRSQVGMIFQQFNLLKRKTGPDEIVDAAVFLAKGALKSGSTLFIDSGQHLLAQDRDVIYLAREKGRQRAAVQ